MPVPMPPPLLLLSDVDGTLLGDDGALPCAPPALRAGIEALRAAWRAPVTVGLASSRTLRELTVLQRALGVYGPCIAEDGALRAIDFASTDAPADTVTDARQRHGLRTLICYEHAADAETLRAAMADQPAFPRADTRRLPCEALPRLGFRTPAAARRALHARSHSVLVDPLVLTDAELDQLRAVSAARGLQLRRGGRWFTLTSAGGKGPALRALRHHFARIGVSPVIAAIGNEENDVSLLAEADLRFVIRNPHRGPHPVLSALPGAIVLDVEGPGGWMEMLDRLSRLGSEAHT
jgi:mannosyl-3-phosphoglycerate phosphatase